MAKSRRSVTCFRRNFALSTAARRALRLLRLQQCGHPHAEPVCALEGRRCGGPRGRQNIARSDVQLGGAALSEAVHDDADELNDESSGDGDAEEAVGDRVVARVAHELERPHASAPPQRLQQGEGLDRAVTVWRSILACFHDALVL